MMTSPRTSTRAGADDGSVNGIAGIVRRLAVTFSPVVPSPRVAPTASRRSS
jgi:hypothetical protein